MAAPGMNPRQLDNADATNTADALSGPLIEFFRNALSGAPRTGSWLGAAGRSGLGGPQEPVMRQYQPPISHPPTSLPFPIRMDQRWGTPLPGQNYPQLSDLLAQIVAMRQAAAAGPRKLGAS